MVDSDDYADKIIYKSCVKERNGGMISLQFYTFVESVFQRGFVR
jgi:hypothetical protein